MKVVIVDTLGAMVAFRPQRIEFLREVYDKIPEAQRENLEVVLNKCREAYDAEVDKCHSTGVKPSSAGIKKDVFGTILYPWLESIGVTVGKTTRSKVVKPSNPRIPKKSEEVCTVQIDFEEVSRIFDNNFPSDTLEDSAPQSEEVIDDNDSLFEGDYFDDAVIDFSNEDTSLFDDDVVDFNLKMEEELL